MLKHILPLIPPHDLYVEPFCGGAAVFFAKPLAKASVINDTNGLLVNFYQQMKLNFNELYRLIDATPYARDMHKKAVHICRNPGEFSDVEKAWALYVNLWQSKFKELNKGFQIENINTNHSLGFYKKKKLFKTCHKLDNCCIENMDSTKLIPYYSNESIFIYADPPYFNSDCGHYKGYTEYDFINLLNVLTETKSKFMLSCYPSDIIYEYIKKYGWSLQTHVQTLSAGNVGRKKTELLVMNYNTQPTLFG